MHLSLGSTLSLLSSIVAAGGVDGRYWLRLEDTININKIIIFVSSSVLV